MGGSQRRHGMAHGAVGEHHGSWGAGKCRSTQGRVDGEFSDQERCLRLALPSAGSAVGGRLDRHRADSRRAVAPAERGGARALGASKRHKSRERRARGHRPWPVNHSLETLTSSYVSRQTAGKPKRARVAPSHPQHSNGNSHMALGDRRSESTTAGSALGCARGRQPRLGLAVRCGDLTLHKEKTCLFGRFFTCRQNTKMALEPIQNHFFSLTSIGSGSRWFTRIICPICAPEVSRVRAG